MPLTTPGGPDARLRFAQLHGAARERALEQAHQYQSEALDFDYFRDGLEADLHSLGLPEFRVDTIAPEDGRYGRDCALSGEMTLHQLMHMRSDPPPELKVRAITPQAIQRTAPLMFEVMVATDFTHLVTLHPNTRIHTTVVSLEELDLIDEYIRTDFFADLNLEGDDDLVEQLRARLNDEIEQLKLLLQVFIDDLNAALWQRFTEELTHQFSETSLAETMYLQEGLFDADGRFLDYDTD